jgi:hypothetical protein
METYDLSLNSSGIQPSSGGSCVGYGATAGSSPSTFPARSFDVCGVEMPLLWPVGLGGGGGGVELLN